MSTASGQRDKRAHIRERSRARRLAMQGLYQWQMTGHDVNELLAQQRAGDEFRTVDAEHYERLLTTAIAKADHMDELLAPVLDRPADQLDPIERAVLFCALVEFEDCLEVPFRVVINEAVDITKRFGGTDGHRFVNGVLDKLAPTLRPAGL
ncbi:MAG: transcription antitermination factor NusB [Pseudomonadota bacterium]